MALDMTAFFERVGIHFKTELERSVRNQVDIADSAYSPVKESTAVSRVYRNNSARRKFGKSPKVKGRGISLRANRSLAGRGKLNAVDFRRLLFTSNFWRGAFRYAASTDSLRVFVSTSRYPSKGRRSLTYDDIVTYNNAGSSAVNPRIQRPPLVFPNTDADAQRMKAMNQAKADFTSPRTRDEILKQLTAGLAPNQTLRITV